MYVYRLVDPRVNPDDMRWDAVRLDCGHTIAHSLTFEEIVDMEANIEGEPDCWQCDDIVTAILNREFDKYARERDAGEGSE